jgi:hypothetical protein
VAKHQLQHYLIFFFGPGAFDEGGVEDFLPAVEALDVGTLLEEGGYFLPISGLL